MCENLICDADLENQMQHGQSASDLYSQTTSGFNSHSVNVDRVPSDLTDRSSTMSVKNETQKLNESSLERADAVVAVEGRFEKLRNLLVPSKKETDPLAEHVCLTLFKGHERIYRLVEDEYGENIVSMRPCDLDALILMIKHPQYEKAEPRWANSGLHRILGADHFHKGLFFLNNLYTNERRGGVFKKTYLEFTPFVWEFNRRCAEITVSHFPDIAETLAQNEAERDYYKEHYVQHKGFKGQEDAIRYHLLVEIRKQFHRYLAAQDWQRFIKPVRAIIKKQRRR